MSDNFTFVEILKTKCIKLNSICYIELTKQENLYIIFDSGKELTITNSELGLPKPFAQELYKFIVEKFYTLGETK